MMRSTRVIQDSKDLLITVSDGSLQEQIEITSSILTELSNKKRNIDNDATVHPKNVSLLTKIPNKDTSMIFVAVKGFDSATDLNIFNTKDNTNNSILTTHKVIGTINLNEISNWHTIKTYDTRVSIDLSHDSTKFNSDYVLKSLFDLQNIKIYLIDDEGNNLVYGNTTTKRPQFTLSIDFYTT